MPRVILHRSRPFRKGDLYIRIRDEKKQVACLTSEDFIEFQLPEGRHYLQADSGRKGKKYLLDLNAPDERVELQVQVPSFKFSYLYFVVLMLVLGIPDSFFGLFEKGSNWGFMLKMGLALCPILILTIKSYPQLKNQLKIEPFPAAA